MTNEVGETTYNYGLLSLIFGDYMADTDFCKEELKGIYCSVRSNFQTGLFKIYGTIGGLLPLVPNKNGTYHVLGQAEVKQVAKQGCIMDDGNGTRMYLAIGRDENNQIISLQGMGTDYYKVNVLLFLGKFLLLLLFVISMVYGMVAFVIHIIRIQKFKESVLYHRRKIQICSELLIIISIGLTFSLLVFSDVYVREIVI